MATFVFFQADVTPLPAGAPRLPLIQILFKHDAPLEVERDTGEPVYIEDVEKGGMKFARLTFETGTIYTLTDETVEGSALGMDKMVEKVEHVSFARREQGV